MEPTTLAISAMLASAALSAKANHDAARRQQAAAREAQGRQLQAQQRATDTAMRRVQDYDPGERKDRNDDIAQEITGNLEQQAAQPMITAQGLQVGATIPDAEGGGDYLKTKAREAAKTTASLRALAALMGRTGAASELRRGEAVRFGDTSGDIGRIGAGANNIWNADQVGIQAAGQPSLGMQLASSALGAYGMGTMASAGVGGGTTATTVPTSPGPLGSGTWYPSPAKPLLGGTVGGRLGTGTWLIPGQESI